ncbi:MULTISPECIES: MAPEG family protein [unclassified Sphingomonas]|jgi:hypothetical protein|uniref:MAPEG family protein n=1 Tax=unclassified Sphingomonas TaxID=196159 RepID=UPI000836E5F4|nr:MULTISPECIES: MAPEG family protein [unclassified Sphingomonas]
MNPAILWPVFAFAALVFVVWFLLFVLRARHIARTPPRDGELATRDGTAAYFRPVERPANNLTNLFEMPVLFLALVPLLVVTGRAGAAQVALAWTFVGLRAVHSAIHIATPAVQPRFLVYLASCIVLAAMWIGLAIDLAAIPA